MWQKRIGSIIGVIFSLSCFTTAIYGSRLFENGVTTFMLYLFLIPSSVALVGAVFNKPFVNVIAFIWLLPACMYFTFGPFLIILHLVAIILMFIGQIQARTSINGER